MSASLNALLVGVLIFEIGLMLFFLNKKPRFKKFAESMTLLIMIMAVVGLIFPFLIEYKIGFYFFPPTYFIAITGWLFIIRKYVIGKNDWYEESDAKKAIRKTWLLLISGFFIITVILVSIAPYIPDWSP